MKTGVNKFIKVLISAILAGISIGLGGLVFLSVDNKVIGSALFTIGLFTVCTSGFSLFTGKVCYILTDKEEFQKNGWTLPVIWIGNLIGTGVVGLLARAARIGAAVSEKAAGLCETKVNDEILSLFVLGILCNILIYIAVDGFRENKHEVGKYLSLFFGVMVFILCGTEHCVADMFYFWTAGAWSIEAVVAVLVITLGNCVGGVLLPLLKKTQKG